MPFRFGAVLSLAAVLGAVPLAGHAASDCELKFGLVAVLSGPASGWGASLREGVAMAEQEANNAGGVKIDGKTCKLTYVAIDSKYSAEAAAGAANELTSQGVKFILGPIGSTELTGVKPIAARNQMLVMASSYAKDAIGPKWPLVFHIGPGPSGWAGPIISQAKAKFGIRNAVIVAPNDQAGTDIATVSADWYKKAGIAVTEEYYQRGTSNFSPIVLRLMGSNPDAIDMVSTPAGDAGTLVKQLRQAGFKGAIGRLGGPSTPEILRVAGGADVVKNMYWYEPVVRDEGINKIDAEYKDFFKKDPPDITLFYQWVAATRLLIKAINTAGTADTVKVAQVLRTLPVDDPSMGKGLWIGQEFFGINQEMSLPFGVGMIVDGKAEPVLKVAAATGK